MACYPLILLIVGLKSHDLPYALSDALKDLIKDCKITRNLHTYLPALPPLPPPLSSFSPRTSNYGDHYHEKPSKRPIEGIVSSNYEISPFVSNENKLKYPTEETYEDDVIRDQIEDIDMNVQNVSKRILVPNVKEIVLNAERTRSIRVPTVDNVVRLINSFKTRSPMVAISDRLLRRLTDYNEEWVEKNPHIVDMNPGKPATEKFLGIPTKYLARLIATKVRKIKKIGSKILDPFGIGKKFKRVIQAAINYLGSDENDKKDDVDEGDDGNGDDGNGGVEWSFQPLE